MPSDQNSSQGRRPQYHRGRRGGDRRGTERRTPPAAADAARGDNVDVDQIMREIRSRISSRHGIDLSSQQIQELAARRLEAILEPRHVKPALLEQMRRAAGERIEVPTSSVETELPFDEAVLYESHRGVIRTLRRLLNPLLKLLFNPAPIARALSAQAVRNNAAAQREAELYARQAEWNALHYEILQRLVTENARSSMEAQMLLHRMEALEAKLDFNERRVRGMELATHQSRPSPRAVEAAAADPASSSPMAASAGSAAELGDGAKRRRRRRRGRRSGFPASEGAANADATGRVSDTDDDGEADGEDGDAVEPTRTQHAASETGALEPAHHFSLLQPAERYPSGEALSSPVSSPAPRAGEDAAGEPAVPAAGPIDTDTSDR